MPNFTLAYYTLTITTPRNEELLLKNFSNTLDLHTAFKNYLTQRSQYHLDDLQQNKLSLVTKYIPKNNTIRGIIKSGQYGLSAELVDTTSLEVTHTKGTTEAEMTPHYFLAYLPSNLPVGILILQKISGKGIQTSLLRDFKNQTRHLAPKGKLELQTIVTKDYFEYLTKNANINKIRLIEDSTPKTIEAHLVQENRNNPPQIEGITEYIIKPVLNHRRQAWDILLEKFNKPKSTSQIARDLGHSCNKVKIEVLIGGKQKTIDIEDYDQIKTDIDITHDIVTNDGGHPTFESIDSEATNLLHSLLKEMGLTETHD